MKYLFKLDTWLSTLFVFASIAIIKILFPLNLYVFDPVHAAMTDFKFNDLAFSRFQKKPGFDSSIVLVNIGDADRSRIIQMLESIKPYQPKVTGLDVMFLQPSADKAIDDSLAITIRQFPGLVIAEKLNWEGKKPITKNFYGGTAVQSGYANLIGEQQGVIRHYSPFEKDADRVYKSFTSAILELADPKAYERLQKRGKEYEMINYRRHANDYMVLEPDDFAANRIEPGFLKDKILLLGYLNPQPEDINDKYFTPLNERLLGKSTPDMNGMVIHANILSMAMDNKYIGYVPQWLSVLIAITIIALLMAYMIHVFINRHIWFHLFYKLLQLASGFVFVFLGVLLLSRAGLYMDFTLLLVALVLSVDILYIYVGLVTWLNKKFGFKTVFPTNEH